jgi:hypothetical protein
MKYKHAIYSSQGNINILLIHLLNEKQPTTY